MRVSSIHVGVASQFVLRQKITQKWGYCVRIPLKRNVFEMKNHTFSFTHPD